MASCSRWATRAICSRPAISTRCAQVPEIVDIGISALKIEGRYKDADYVALTTARLSQGGRRGLGRPRRCSVDRAAELQLEQVYSRGLGPFFLTGTNHQAVVQGRAPRHRGVLMGRVTRVTDDGVVIEPSEAHRVAPLKPGDGVVFDAADWRSPEEPEEGGRIFEVQPRDGKSNCASATASIASGRIRRGDLVWRTHDPDLDKAARVYTRSHRAGPQAAGQRARDGARGRAARAPNGRVGARQRDAWTVADAAWAPRRIARIDEEYLREQFGRLGNTPYELAEVELELDGSPFAPSSHAESAAARGGGAAAGRARRAAAHRRSVQRRSPRAATPRRRLEPPRPRSTCWSARRNNSTPPSRSGPPASRSTISISTACGPRSSACTPPASRRASPARAS